MVPNRAKFSSNQNFSWSSAYQWVTTAWFFRQSASLFKTDLKVLKFLSRWDWISNLFDDFNWQLFLVKISLSKRFSLSRTLRTPSRSLTSTVFAYSSLWLMEFFHCRLSLCKPKSKQILPSDHLLWLNFKVRKVQNNGFCNFEAIERFAA